jgi:hypothetical protein
MTIQNTTRLPKDGSYATLSADGRSVICHMRRDESRYCPQRLAYRFTFADRWEEGVHHTVLAFDHDGWEEHNGVWRLPPALAARLRQGLSVPVGLRPRYTWEPALKGFMVHDTPVALPTLPARVRCWRCANKRTLDGLRLDAVGALECRGWDARPGRAAKERPFHALLAREWDA